MLDGTWRNPRGGHQLQVIETLRFRSLAAWSAVDRDQLRHIWPVIVTAGDIVQSELLWNYVQEQAPDLLQHPQVQPVTLLDLDDLGE